jgi:hypothetical protein
MVIFKKVYQERHHLLQELKHLAISMLFTMTIASPLKATRMSHLPKMSLLVTAHTAGMYKKYLHWLMEMSISKNSIKRWLLLKLKLQNLLLFACTQPLHGQRPNFAALQSHMGLRS